MIVGDPKPLEEIAASISAFQRVLVLGCGGGGSGFPGRGRG